MRARVNLLWGVEVRPRRGGLASAGRDRWSLGLVELGVLLPFVDLGHWDSMGGDGADGWAEIVC